MVVLGNIGSFLESFFKEHEKNRFGIVNVSRNHLIYTLCQMSLQACTPAEHRQKWLRLREGVIAGGTSLIRNCPPFVGPSLGPRHTPTVGS